VFATNSISGSVALSSCILGLSVLFVLPTAGLAQSTFTVNTIDDADDGSCDGVHCSLREAIIAANGEPGSSRIEFDIEGMGPHTIQPLSELPAVLDSVTLDGTSEPDFAGSPVVELDGTLAGASQGLNIAGSGVTVRGLVINRFEINGIQITEAATGNSIEGNYIGTDVTGSVSLGNGNAGVMVGEGGNTIGGTTPSSRNVISGSIEGVTVVRSDLGGNRILGNYIGVNASGDAAVPNNVGVLLLASGNTVGGTNETARNIISGNSFSGVNIEPNYSDNVVVGNYIGTDATGSIAIGNDIDVFINNAPNNTVGGTSPGARNVISGGREGVTLWDPGATGNRILGNYIGTDAGGSSPLPNDVGIACYGPQNVIGGSATGAGNVLSGNRFQGIKLEGETATGNVLAGNYIGTSATGSEALSNAEHGILVLNAPDNTIGGTESGAGNVISGNPEGLTLSESGSTGNQVLGNYVGTNASGDQSVPNGIGILFFGAHGNVIGGTVDGARNVISGNRDGVSFAEGSTSNVVTGNYIGTNAAGNAVVGNSSGVLLVSSSNTIGGAQEGAGNVISGNQIGINVNFAASDNWIAGNFIGTDPTGTLDLGNSAEGILIWDDATGNRVGGPEPNAGNTIAYNGASGVTLGTLAGSGNTIRSNIIFANGALGIDLGVDGVTENDDGDLDGGPNELQNFPLLSVVPSQTGYTVSAVLDSGPDANYLIEIFSNEQCDDSGYGEGKTLRGTGTLTTDATGHGSITPPGTGAVLPGTGFTATATDENGSTSEFAPCVKLVDFLLGIDPSSRTLSAGDSTTYTITIAAEGGEFDKTVTLSCSGMPDDAEYEFSEVEVIPGSGQVTSTLTVRTVAPSKSRLSALVPGRDAIKVWTGLLLVFAMTAWIPAAAREGRLRLPRKRRVWTLLALVTTLLILASACGDDNTVAPPPGGTPSGTHQFTVTGTWESVERSAQATLVVE
jgi:CSLREA domain-containing protein